MLALSGGIDSALVALLAVDALGPERVTCVSMPSPYSSEGTRADARAIAANLGCRFEEIPIADAMAAYDEMLAEAFAGREPDIAEENVQARIRGNVVMALSNKFGCARAHHRQQVRAVGGLRHALRRHGGRLRGAEGRVQGLGLPAGALAQRGGRPRAGAGQRARAAALGRAARRAARQDSLPPYDVLDAILEGYVEEDLDAVELVRRGLPAEDVERVIRMVDRAEYKRRQAPPGIKISTKAFGRDRRLPITNRYTGRSEDAPARRLRALS